MNPTAHPISEVLAELLAQYQARGLIKPAVEVAVFGDRRQPIAPSFWPDQSSENVVFNACA